MALTTSRSPCFLIHRQIKTWLRHALPLGKPLIPAFSPPQPSIVTIYHLNFSRSGLPSEALEEFLSILRPSFFPPTSPILRTRRQGASLPTFQHERSFSYKSRGRLEIASQKNDGDDIDISRSTQPSRNTCPSTPDSLNDPDGTIESDGDSPSLRWFKANILCESIPSFARLHLSYLDTYLVSFSDFTHSYPKSFLAKPFQSLSWADITPLPSCHSFASPNCR